MNQHGIIMAAVALLLLALLAFNAIQPLRAEEPRRALVAYEMLNDGNFINPHLHGENYYNKPPVYNWLIAGSMKMFGTGPGAARLPGVLSFICIGLLIYFILKTRLDKQQSMLTAFAFLTSAELLFYGTINTAEIDIFYALITMLQVGCIFWFHEKNDYLKLFVYSYLFMGIGFLTKGIPSLAFQAITLVAYLAQQRKFVKLFSWQHALGIFLGVGIIVFYLFLYSKEADVAGFLSQQFKESSQRTANEYGLKDVVLQLFRFPIFLFEKLLPWSLFAGFLLLKPVRQFLMKDKLYNFMMVFLLANIIIYWTAPDPRARYLYMFFPFIIALLVAAAYHSNWAKSRYAQVLEKVFIATLALAGLGVIALPFVFHIASAFNILIALLCSAGLFFLAYRYYHSQHQIGSLWFLITGMIIVRIAYTVFVLPHISKIIVEQQYLNITKSMLRIANQKPIYLTGTCEYAKPNISLLGHTIYKHWFRIPPTIPYQIPYNYAHIANRIMYYKEAPRDTTAIYLAFEDSVADSTIQKVYYRFEAENVKRNMILFSLNVPAASSP